jgi:hypothetical protein
VRARADLDAVAELAHEPEPTAALTLVGLPLSAGPPIRVVPVVGDLTDEGTGGLPHLERAGAERMPEDVRRHLVDGKLEVCRPRGVESSPGGAFGDQPPQPNEPPGVGEGDGVGARRWLGQRGVAGGRQNGSDQRRNRSREGARFGEWRGRAT